VRSKRSARWGAVVAAAALCCAAAAPLGRCDPAAPERSAVAVVRAERILVPEGIRAPAFLYPEGRVEYGVVEDLLDQAVMATLGHDRARDAWRALISPGDRVGIQIDVDGIEAHDAVLDVLVRRIADAGVPLRNIIIYAGEETALFRAGFDLSGLAPGATLMASDDLGYRGGLSRIVLDHCTKVISLSRLRVDPDLGMRGALATCLQSVPYAEREHLERDPATLAEAAANSALRRMIVLHIFDALWPIIGHPDGGGDPETWQFGGVMASTDPVALDVVGREVLLDKLREEDPDRRCLEPPVLYLEPATEVYRLGNSDASLIDVTELWPLGGPPEAPETP